VRPGIVGIGCYLPERVVSSDEVEQMVNAQSAPFRLPMGIVRMASGVEERRYARDDQSSSDLAAAAATAALADAEADPDEVDLVIFAAASHDVSEPATANLVQTKTRCSRAAVFDVKNACNSFLNGLDIAMSMIETKRSRCVLVTAGEVLSPTVRWDFESAADLRHRLASLTLGDAGAACVVAPTTDGALHRGAFVSDGSHWDLSTVMSGGTLLRQDSSRMYFECDSGRLLEVATEHLPAVISSALDGLGWSLEDVDLVVPHQVSKAIVDFITREMGFPRERCQVTLDRFGNTAAASIPLALATAVAEDAVAPGDRILLVGGAAGFSAGVLGVEWGTRAGATPTMMRSRVDAAVGR
jgi:3-oxoacyl-[acyl-carrier-protein] synthase-3